MKKQIKVMLAFAIVLSFAFTIPQIPVKPFRVIIDAGHGGRDYGAKTGQATEKDITEAIAQKIKLMNKDQNIEIYVTRNGDTFMDLKDRVQFVNSLDANLLISLHVSSDKDVASSGMGIYTYTDSSHYKESTAYANQLKNKLSENKNWQIAPIKEASFYILKNVNTPALHLDLGYLSNAKDKAILSSTDGQDEISNAILDYIQAIR
ncbi:N-acetylmuramoyl-L-alanine amidase family protein [Flavobacterium kingsejongi]|uniref:N-acetylmuramoyl-L-alanine amidase n=1 Tax=Flavobacterium kingsejongi TaxID=1678728 RepID=A0A2S1LQA8_9FLAO|nr:N-acetylmuramoyl-L-alanine amidase [Flavobacterium kingsejongi]AWG25943.1 hypothetical protein FK004_12275 [Flavobacterium kingsejongi]